MVPRWMQMTIWTVVIHMQEPLKANLFLKNGVQAFSCDPIGPAYIMGLILDQGNTTWLVLIRFTFWSLALRPAVLDACVIM